MAKVKVLAPKTIDFTSYLESHGIFKVTEQEIEHIIHSPTNKGRAINFAQL